MGEKTPNNYTPRSNDELQAGQTSKKSNKKKKERKKFASLLWLAWSLSRPRLCLNACGSQCVLSCCFKHAIRKCFLFLFLWWVLCFISKDSCLFACFFHVSDITLWLQCPHDEGLQLISRLHFNFMHLNPFFSLQARGHGLAVFWPSETCFKRSEGEIKGSGSAAVWRCFSRSCESEEWKENKKERIIMFHLWTKSNINQISYTPCTKAIQCHFKAKTSPKHGT